MARLKRNQFSLSLLTDAPLKYRYTSCTPLTPDNVVVSVFQALLRFGTAIVATDAAPLESSRTSTFIAPELPTRARKAFAPSLKFTRSKRSQSPAWMVSTCPPAPTSFVGFTVVMAFMPS